jgi:hypothetical protein
MSKRVGVTIPDNKVIIWDNFVKYVEKKWGKKHSMVALELINILEAFLKNKEGGIDPLQINQHTHTISDFQVLGTENTVKRRYKSLNTSTNGNGRIDKFDQEIEEIKKRIKERFPQGAYSISKQLIYGIIGDVCKVTDRRTMKARAAVLVSQGHLIDMEEYFSIPANESDTLAVKSSVGYNGNSSNEEEQCYEGIT